MEAALRDVVVTGRRLVEPAHDRNELLRRDPIGRIRRWIQECDPAVPVGHDVSSEVQPVVAARPPDGLAGGERPQFRVGDDDRPSRVSSSRQAVARALLCGVTITRRAPESSMRGRGSVFMEGT